ncbi:MAG: tRNA pseudouridine(38-40) synthase TruA [Akkermansia sp.]
MPRLLFTCSYDGNHFCGWQSQLNGQSAQDCMEQAFETILGQKLRISASGRTDAGVHALAQPFHVDVPDDCKMPLKAWIPALNYRLPPALRVVEVAEVDPRFHARYDAERKTYEYLIELADVCSPFEHGRVWHKPPQFDKELLKLAFASYEGLHDFRMFASRRGNEPDVPPAGYYERHIFSATVQEEGSLLRLRVCGSGFMYRMVRMLVGTAHQVARGKISMADLKAMMDSPDPVLKSRFCAPPQGLYLHSVEY